MLQMSGPTDWEPPIVATVAAEGQGTTEMWDAVLSHRRHLEERGLLEGRRRARLDAELHRILVGRFDAAVGKLLARDAYQQMHDALFARRSDPEAVADELMAGVADLIAGAGGGRYGSVP
jgi:LAO/AO transport system kinase